MTDSMTSCPTAEQLQALLDESLPPDQQAFLQNHLDGCAACQHVLETLVAGSESWDAAVGHLRGESPAPIEPVLSEAVRRIKEDDFADRPTTGPTRPLDFLQPSDQPGSLGRLGVYEVSEVVGQGGMGIVVKAFDPTLHRVVAVKVLAPYLAHNPLARKRFVREAQAIAAVSHDHVITIHAIDESVEQPKIVMQFIAGQSLQQKLDAEGSLDLKEILRIGMQTAAGLAAAHAQGLVHRDVKPSNILLENGVQRVKLTDFGLARAVDDASLTHSGVIAGTPQYMAPEQANGDAVDYRADLFSLGSVIYAMCVGHSPFRASTTMGVLKRVCHDPPRPIQEINPDIPGWLCDIVMKLLAKSPADRIQSAKQVAALLEKWLAHVQQPTVVPQPGATAPPTASNPVVEPIKSTTLRPDRSLNARTIFFQSISFRLLLFLWLVGMAGTIAANISTAKPYRMDFQELLLVSGLMGLIVAFWGALLVSVGRFFWANALILRQWIQGTAFNVPPTEKPSATTTPKMHRLPPESVAVLAGIGTLLISANVLIAAVVAIVVWRISVHRAGEIGAGSVSKAVGVANGARSRLQGYYRSVGESLEQHPERTSWIVVNAWRVAGAIDLLWALILMADRFGPWWILFAVVFTVISFVTASLIHARQKLDTVIWASYLGLLPLCIGAVVRVPLSVATLFWVYRPDVKASFAELPWKETRLGRLLGHSAIRKFLHGVGTLTLLTIWSLFCLTLTVIVVVLYVLYGPSTYSIEDKSAANVTIQGHVIRIVARGSGSATGLLLPDSTYRPDTVEVYSQRRSYSQILLEPSQIVMNRATRDLTEGDLAELLHAATGIPQPEQAANLYRVIKQLQMPLPAEVHSNGASPSVAQRMQAVIWEMNDHVGGPHRTLEGYSTVAELLDPTLFQITRAANRSDVSHTCKPVTWLALSMGGGLLLVWLVGFGGIVVNRRRRKSSVPGT